MKLSKAELESLLISDVSVVTKAVFIDTDAWRGASGLEYLSEITKQIEK